MSSSGKEAAECIQEAVSSHARAGFEVAGAGGERVENDAVMLLSLTGVENEEGTEEVNSCIFETVISGWESLVAVTEPFLVGRFQHRNGGR